MSKSWQMAVCCMVLTSVVQATAKEETGFESGAGTQERPWMIADAAQLDYLRSYLGASNANAYFALANDIDLTAYLSPGGDGYSKWGTAGWEPIGYPQQWPDRKHWSCRQIPSGNVPGRLCEA